MKMKVLRVQLLGFFDGIDGDDALLVNIPLLNFLRRLIAEAVIVKSRADLDYWMEGFLLN